MKFPCEILARGHGSKPSHLTATGFNDRRSVMVHGGRPDMAIGWHLTAAFVWDAELFEKIKAAYEHLESLWKDAVPLVDHAALAAKGKETP